MGASFWTSGAAFTGRSDQPPHHADVVVVGGGLAGVGTALRAARHGLRVVVVDGDAAGAASAAAAGMVVRVPAAFAIAFFTRGPAALDGLLDLSASQVSALPDGAEVSRHHRFRLLPRPHLHLALSAREEEMGGVLHRALTERGLAARMLSPSDLGAYIGHRPAPSVRGGLLIPGGAAVNPAWLLEAWTAMARACGALVVTGVDVTELRADDGDRFVSVVTGDGAIRARTVVVAAGHRTPELLPETAGWAAAVTAQMLAYAPRRPGVLNALVTASLTDNGEYLHQLPGGEILVGGCRSDLDTASGTAVTGPTQSAIENVLPTLFPDFTAPPVTHRWAGPLTGPPDGLPVVDRVRPRVWVNTAQSDGLSYAYGIADQLVEAILDDDPSRLDESLRRARLDHSPAGVVDTG